MKAAPRTLAVRSVKTPQIPAPRFALPAELTQPAFALGAFGAASQPARPADTSAQQASQQAIQQANTAAATMATQSGSTTAPTGKYSGEPISVNLKDVDLRDFFRLIHEISGLNVVLDPAVKGTLTIVLDEVPWDQALDIVLQNNGLDKQLNGNVLRIATRDTLKKEAETQRDLEKAQADATTPVTVTRVPVSMGKAVEVYAKVAALKRLKPSSSFRIIISTAIMASSTSRPRAITSAPSEMRCRLMPSMPMTTNVIASTNGMHTATTTPGRSPRLTKLTSNTITTASVSARVK